jgi:hypothetical protein
LIEEGSRAVRSEVYAQEKAPLFIIVR